MTHDEEMALRERLHRVLRVVVDDYRDKQHAAARRTHRAQVPDGLLDQLVVMAANVAMETFARPRCCVCAKLAVTAFDNDHFCAQHADLDPRGIAERERLGEG